jgi:hypothetical protein
MSRHWSFVITGKRYLYPLVAVLLAAGAIAAFHYRDATLFSRVGNFVIGIGVWMSMRSTLRDGIQRTKSVADSSPVIPGTNQLNANYFNNITFALGDAFLQLHGFALVLVGSLIGSYGDLALAWLFPAAFGVK